ncbi:MAG TPA: exosortase-associated EpsI family protein [Tepidisphaeraceae bacterium]|jgi:hypothetical protein|nr:exosortase-associated EpsI family protein [Tepidisphaeraceae bacterium]
MKFAKPRYIPAILTVALLLGLTAETLLRPRPADAEPFHARVKAAALQMSAIDGWTSADLEVPAAAVALLKPNIMICRQYSKPGRQVQFLLVQCRDARDMGGHYPPVCYPAQGWIDLHPRDPKPMVWTIGSKTIVGMEYEFSYAAGGQSRSRIVDNLLILPAGRYAQSMDEIHEVAADYLRQFYGAAQIQLVFDGGVPEKERREIFEELIGKNMTLLTVLEHSDEPRNPN